MSSTPKQPFLKRKTDNLVDEMIQQLKSGERNEFTDEIVKLMHSKLKVTMLEKQKPKFDVKTHFTKLSLTSRAHYQSLIDEARICLTENNFSELRKHLMPKLRQICIHFDLFKVQVDEPIRVQYEHHDVSTDLNLKSILTRRVLQEKDECPICLTIPTHTVITKCAHIFCQKCIKKWFDRENCLKCAYCRRLLKKHEIFSEAKPDTKLEILRKLLREDTSNNSKSIVFSRYPDALNYFYKHLHNAEFKRLLVDTTKEDKSLENSIKEFKINDGVKVLFVDFETACRQKTLINVPCKVFILDACRKSVEEELVARVTKPVCVSRFITLNTIEDKIMSLDLKERFNEGHSFDFNDNSILTYLLKV